MTLPERLADGRIRIPRRAEGPGGIIGDGADVIGPDDPLYLPWLEYLERRVPAGGGISQETDRWPEA